MMVMLLMVITIDYYERLWGVADCVHQKGQGVNCSPFVLNVSSLIPCSLGGEKTYK